jgi:hypothetical protein
MPSHLAATHWLVTCTLWGLQRWLVHPNNNSVFYVMECTTVWTPLLAVQGYQVQSLASVCYASSVHFVLSWQNNVEVFWVDVRMQALCQLL